MKRLGLYLALLFVFALPAVSSTVNTNTDMLLTSGGTLYTVESRFGLNGAGSLYLTTQRGESVSTSVIPAASGEGSHTRPALAYDAASDTLFVFWQKAPSPVATELLFCSYRDGKWSEPTSIDRGAFRLRFNLGIGVTLKIETIGSEGERTVVPGLTAHVTWWEETGSGEFARYAMLSIDKGKVESITIRDLSDFLAAGSTEVKESEEPASDVLRHPALFESAQETIDVVFGNVQTRKLHRITLKPVSDGRIRIPIGVKERAVDAPRHRLAPQGDSRISAVTGASEDGLVFYATSESELKYIRFENGRWTPVRSISLNEKVTADAAVMALKRMSANQ